MKQSYPKEFKELKKRYKLFTTDDSQRRQRLSCVQCKDILIEPYQTQCGCRYCYSCLTKCENVCHQCGFGGESKKTNMKIIFDKAAERLIFGSIINCLNKQCEHTCKLSDLIGHLETCEYNERDKFQMCTIKCTYCGVELCGQELIEKHKNIRGDVALLCDNWKSVCPYKCSEEVQDNIKMHLNICPTMPIECPMKGAGCTQLLPRFEMVGHIRNILYNHKPLIMQEIINVRTEKKGIKSVNLKFVFPNILKQIEEARGSTVRKLSSFTDDEVIPNITLFFSLILMSASNFLCVFMDAEHSPRDNREQDSDMDIGIKWKKCDAVDKSIQILSNNANMQSGYNAKTVNIYKSLDGFKNRDKDELSFHVEITAVAIPESERAGG